MPGRPDVGNGSAEAARWVADALGNAREWFPEMSEEQLRGPLEHAFEMASRASRGEQEFHSVFEAELRRAIEERSVVGSAASVLPAQSGDAPKTFPLVAAAAPEPEPADAEPTTVEAADAEPEDDRDGEAEDDGDGDGAQALALRVGALRFHEGLSPDEIRAELGVDEDYYAEVMRWLMARADQTLDGDYPRHLDGRRMLSHAAGVASNEESFAVERHVRECPGCATYLADLFDATLVELVAEPGAVPDPQAPHMSYTRATVRRPEARPGRRMPFLTLRAEELRGYARSAEAAAAASAPVDAPEIRPIRRAARAPVVRRPVPRRVALRAVALVATLLVLVTAGVVALTGGGDDSAPKRDGTAGREAGPSDAELLARARARERVARRQAAERKQATRRRAQARRRTAQRRRQQAQRDAAPAPGATSPAPAPVSPAPTAPSGGSGGSGEFGLEP